MERDQTWSIYCITVRAMTCRRGDEWSLWPLEPPRISVTGSCMVQFPFISTKFYTVPCGGLGDGISLDHRSGGTAAVYYVCAKKLHSAVPDQLILRPSRTAMHNLKKAGPAALRRRPDWTWTGLDAS